MGHLPVDGDSDELKRTNEIAKAIPLLETLDLKDKNITADALLTQRKLAQYLGEEQKAHYYFTVKSNQPTLLQDIVLFFQDRKEPDFVEHPPPPTIGASRPATSGLPLRSPATSTSPTSARLLPLNATPAKRKAGNNPMKSPTVSPADPNNRPTGLRVRTDLI